MAKTTKGTRTQELLENLSLSQLDYFYKNKEMQEVVLWQLSHKNRILYQVYEEREKLSSVFFVLADQEMGGKSVDLRAIESPLVAIRNTKLHILVQADHPFLSY